MTDKILEALEIGLELAKENVILAKSKLAKYIVYEHINKIEAAIELYEETDGATIPKNGVIAKWLASDEGKEAIKKSLADSAETIAILNKARKVTFEQLNTPMGLTALPPAPVLTPEDYPIKGVFGQTILGDDEIIRLALEIRGCLRSATPYSTLVSRIRTLLEKVTK